MLENRPGSQLWSPLLTIAFVGIVSSPTVVAGDLDGAALYESRLLNPLNQASTDSPVFFSSVQYLTGSDWTQIADVSGNWKDLYRPGSRNIAISKAQASVGVFFQEWGFAYIRRSDISITSNRDALDLLYLQKNNLSSPVGTVFRPEVHAYSLSAHGPQISKRTVLFEHEDVRLWGAVGVGYLSGVSMRQADLQGLVQRTSASNYSLLIPTLSDINSNKTYPFMGDDHATGSGYAVDVALQAKWLGRHQAWLTVDDWQTRMQWKQVPSTRATADSRTVSLGKDGYLAYAPAIQGINARVDVTQRIEPTVTVGYAHDIGAVTLSAESLRMAGVSIPNFTLKYRVSDKLHVVAGKDFRFQTIKGGVAWNNWAIFVFSQPVDITGSQAYGLSLRYQLNFASP
jgi:hypothetical protein